MTKDELYKKNIYISKLRYKSCLELFDSLKHIDYVIIKGEPLSMYCYNLFGMRNSSDIDILIDKKNLSLLEKVLEKGGFISTNTSRHDRILMLSYSHQVAPWFKNIINNLRLYIDINIDVLWGERSDKCIDINNFISDSVCLNIFGCEIKTLTPSKMLIQVALHHYKEMNSLYHLYTHNSLNINLFNDIYHLFKNRKNDIDINELYDFCDKNKITKYIYYIFYYTNKIFNDKELAEATNMFKTEDGMFLLDKYGLTSNEQKTWNVDFGTRLNSNNMCELIKSQLSFSDMEKINYNKKIFNK